MLIKRVYLTIYPFIQVPENVSLTFVPAPTFSGGFWIDSSGGALMVENTVNRRGPGGPPPGYNIVLRVGEAVVGWPPAATVKTMERNNVCDRKYLLYF